MEAQKIKNILTSLQKDDFYKNANLHIHSKFSDGAYDFDTLVEQALSLNLKYFSITDHNTVEGYKHTKYLDNPALIHGVEFDCFYETALLHILGYGIDINSEHIKKLCAKNISETKYDVSRIFKSRHPKNAIEGIHNAGGIAVLAHPCCCSTVNLDNFVKKLVDMGLDGIETYYPYDRHRGVIKFYSRKKAFEIGSKYNLILTGGTDAHNGLIKK